MRENRTYGLMRKGRREPLLYPFFLGSIRSRTITFDVRERFWALDDILDKIHHGTELMRAKVTAAG